MTPTQHAPFTPEQSRRAMRLAVIGQCFGVPLEFALIFGGLATLYAKQFGADDVLVGWANAAVTVGLALTFFLPGYVERHNKRRVLLVSIALTILLMLPVVLLPQIASATSQRFALVLLPVALLLYSFCSSGMRASWFPILRDFVPHAQTGRFFGRLRLSWQIVAIVLYLFFSVAFREDAPAEFFQIILAVLVFGVFVRLLLFTKLPQRTLPAIQRRSVADRFRMVFADRSFRRFILFSIGAMGTLRFIEPSLIVYGRLLGFSYRTLMFGMLAKMAAAAIGYAVWGRMTDRHGPGRAYRQGLMLIALALMMWCGVSWLSRSAEQQTAALVLMMIAFALQGASQAGIGLAVTRHSFQLTPREHAPTYLAFHPASLEVGCGLGALAMGYIFAALGAASYSGWMNPYILGAMAFAVVSVALATTVHYLSAADPPRPGA